MEYKKNDIAIVTIEDIGTEGEGIGKLDGFTFFIVLQSTNYATFVSIILIFPRVILI